MAEQTLNQNEMVERVRKAVLAAGGSVTVGDIVSKTGLGQYEAKSALDKLMTTHEGTMRVSQNGDLLYAFSAGLGLRDARTWWERNRKAIYRGFKKVFKIVIMLVLVIYFIIYLLLIIALLASNRNGNSNSNLNVGGIWYYFWGYSAGRRDAIGSAGTKKAPLYTRVYNFVFGPEEDEIDPLMARQMCAQLIRAKNGVITAEEWMIVSGQSLKKSESDLARYTAEFEGNAEITENGTLVYVFADMMKSTKMDSDKGAMNKRNKFAWDRLEAPRPLSGNINGGNGAVIALNLFNLFMACFVMLGGIDMLLYPDDPSLAQNLEYTQSVQAVTFWLGIFPFIFSSLIFAIPLLRLPGNIKENRARRERSVKNAALSAILPQNSEKRVRASLKGFTQAANQKLARAKLPLATPKEISKAVLSICDELGGEIDLESMEQVYVFENMEVRLGDAQEERTRRQLDRQDLGRVVFSSDAGEQERIDDENEKDEMDAFDRALQESSGKYDPDYGAYGKSGSTKSGASRDASY